MRVVHVAPTVFGRDGLFGGGERYPLELARAVATLNGACELVTFGARDTRFVDPVEPALTVHVLRSWGRLGHHPAHPLSPHLLAGLGAADIVHTHQMRAAPSRVAAVARAVLGRRVVVTDHGLAGSDWAGVLPRLFDRLLAVSRWSAAQLNFSPARTTVVYGGANPARFAPDPHLSRRGVLFVGRLTPHKGIDRLIQALPERAQLTVVGTAGHDQRPPERDYPIALRDLAVDREVRFVTNANDDDVGAFYRRAEVLVLPSVEVTCYGRRIAVPELLGLSVLEAMASATPVVASDVGGVAEIVIDGETGWLVPSGDVAALHDRLAWMLAHPTEARRMGDNARQHVLSQFTWQHCAQRCIDAYRATVA